MDYPQRGPGKTTSLPRTSEISWENMGAANLDDRFLVVSSAPKEPSGN